MNLSILPGTDSSYAITRFVFQRLLGAIYVVAFLIAVFQFKALCGEQGLLPVRLFVKRVDFWQSPSLFYFRHSDAFVTSWAVAGLVLALIATSGISDLFGTWISGCIWFALWAIYLSFVNVGQTFYGFGWETLLLETGFLAIFLGPLRAPPWIVLIFLLRWILFRLMLGAGLIKIRGDECWRDLTCLDFHYETQPSPGPLSWSFSHSPIWINRAGVLFNHFTELIVPFGYFGPRNVRLAAGIITIIFQVTLILSGNLSWLNCISIVLCFACFDDAFFIAIGRKFSEIAAPEMTLTGWPAPVLWLLLAVIAFLSVRPALNLVSRGQMMNSSFEPLHLVNTYGAFGSVSRERFEIEIEGTRDSIITPDTKWRAYQFKGKPGEVDRRPPQVTPYHYKLDWQMWFAAMGPYYQSPWFVNLVAKLLNGQKDVLALFRINPFRDRPPKYVRAELYQYHFTKPGEADWWRRERVGPFLPPLSLDDPGFKQVLESQGWLEEKAVDGATQDRPGENSP